MPSSAFEGLEHTCRVCKDWIKSDDLGMWNEGGGKIWFVHRSCHPDNPLTKQNKPANLLAYPESNPD